MLHNLGCWDLQPFEQVMAAVKLQATVALWPSHLEVLFQLSGADAVYIPKPIACPGFRHELWTNTCFEIFISRIGQKCYREWNFSPNGCWAAYDFKAYRQPSPHAYHSSAPYCDGSYKDEGYELEVKVPLRGRSQQDNTAELGEWQLGLSAVLIISGQPSYWALKHPGPRPDFHDCAGFVLQSGLAIDEA